MQSSEPRFRPSIGKDAGVSTKQKQNAGSIDSNSDSRVADHRDRFSGVLSIACGGILAGGFYAVVYATAWAPLQRYFLGHPVAVRPLLVSKRNSR